MTYIFENLAPCPFTHILDVINLDYDNIIAVSKDNKISIYNYKTNSWKSIFSGIYRYTISAAYLDYKTKLLYLFDPNSVKSMREYSRVLVVNLRKRTVLQRIQLKKPCETIFSINDWQMLMENNRIHAVQMYAALHSVWDKNSGEQQTIELDNITPHNHRLFYRNNNVLMYTNKGIYKLNNNNDESNEHISIIKNNQPQLPINGTVTQSAPQFTNSINTTTTTINGTVTQSTPQLPINTTFIPPQLTIDSTFIEPAPIDSLPVSSKVYGSCVPKWIKLPIKVCSDDVHSICGRYNSIIATHCGRYMISFPAQSFNVYVYDLMNQVVLCRGGFMIKKFYNVAYVHDYQKDLLITNAFIKGCSANIVKT